MSDTKGIRWFSQAKLDTEIRAVGEELPHEVKRKLIDGGQPKNEKEKYYQDLWHELQSRT